MKKQSNLSRLINYAGPYRVLVYLSWILSGVSAVLALLPFYYLWKIIQEVLNVMPDFARATELTYNGWMALITALASMMIYIAGLMCSHIAAFRVQTNAEQAKAKSDVKVTMLAFVIKAVVAALKKFPEFNASLDGDTLVYKQYYNIGFAADTPNGLVVPVLKDADKKGILQISKEMGELAKKARDGKLGAADMQGGCFSISSLGGIGGTNFTPIVNAPEVAILGLSRSSMQPVWNEEKEKFVPRLMLPLSLSYDHRVIDGAAAARFNAFLGQVLADYRRILL